MIRLQAVPDTLQCIPTVKIQKETAREVLLLVFRHGGKFYQQRGLMRAIVL